MKLLFIDFSNTDEIKILNTKVGKSLQIYSAYYLPNFENESDAVAMASEKLKEVKLINIPAVIIPPRNLTKYHTFNLPKIPIKEIEKILPREIKKRNGTDDEYVIDFKFEKSEPKDGENQIDVVAYYMKKDDVWGLLEDLKNNGINPINIIPEVQGIEVFIQNNINQNESKGSALVTVEMMPDKINMNIFNGVLWALNREFPFKVGKEDETLGERDFSRISTEFSRTFQYFKQKNKNVNIDNSIVYGSNRELNDLNNFINDNLGLNSKIIGDYEMNCRIMLPPKIDDPHEFFSIFFTTIATANSIIKKKNIDLFPNEFRDKEKFPRQMLILSIISVVILMSLVILSTLIMKQKSQYRDDLKKITGEYKILQEQIDKIMEVRKKRKEYYEKIVIIEKPQIISFEIGEFIRNISLLVGDDLPIEISKLNINPEGEKNIFFIKGKLYSENINDSLKVFDILLKKLKTIKGVEVKNFIPPSSSTASTENNIQAWSFSIWGSKEISSEIESNEK